MQKILERQRKACTRKSIGVTPTSSTSRMFLYISRKSLINLCHWHPGWGVDPGHRNCPTCFFLNKFLGAPKSHKSPPAFFQESETIKRSEFCVFQNFCDVFLQTSNSKPFGPTPRVSFNIWSLQKKKRPKFHFNKICAQLRKSPYTSMTQTKKYHLERVVTVNSHHLKPPQTSNPVATVAKKMVQLPMFSTWLLSSLVRRYLEAKTYLKNLEKEVWLED